MPKVTRLPDGTYQARISVIDPTTGKRHQPRVRARSKRALEDAIAEERARIRRGEVHEPDTTPLSEWLDTWYATYRPPAESSRANRRQAVNRIQRDEVARIALGRLRRVHVQAFIDRLAAAYAPRTVRETAGTLAMALDRAVLLDVIPRSPASQLILPRVGRRQMAVWDDAEVRAVMAVVDGADDEAWWLLALSLGVRIGELVALRWSDVDLERGRLTIARTLTRDEDERLTIGETTKSPAGHRTITLPLPVTAALARHRRRSAEARLAFGPLWEPDDAVFDDGTGGHWRSARRFRRRFREVVELAGVPLIRPHDMRHTAATAMIRAGHGQNLYQAHNIVRSLGEPVIVDVPIEDTVAAAHEADAVAIVAHPGRDEGKGILTAELLDQLRHDAPVDGVEAHYRSYKDADVRRYRDWAAERGLLVSTGSDSHRPGFPVDPIAYEARWSAALLERLGIQVEPWEGPAWEPAAAAVAATTG